MSVYLVTGGAGFIGSHIVDRLVEKEEEVRIIDDFSTGKMENIERNLGKITLINGSVADMDCIKHAMEGVDYVFHEAAIVSVPRSVEDPVTCNEINITGALNILKCAKDAGAKRVVCASSSAIYGDSPNLPKIENMASQPLSPYALSKLVDEYYCRMFTQLYGLETVCLRYFNVFGPRQDPASEYSAVIPKFLSMMIQGKSPVIYGDGTQSRDFIYVEDVVSANLLACHRPGVGGEVFNIAGGKSLSLLELVETLNKILGETIQPIFETARVGDVKHSLADIRKAEQYLGFLPEFKFDDGLNKLTAWFKAQAD